MRAVPACKLNPSLAQRVALYALAVALVLAPVLANLWPAFGKGPMLYAGDPAPAAEHAGHAHHTSHGDSSADADGADPSSAETERTGDPSAVSHGEHTQHCALCVLASLGWAPFVAFATPALPRAVSERAAPAATQARHPAPTWRSAQPRAPPLSS